MYKKLSNLSNRKFYFLKYKKALFLIEKILEMFLGKTCETGVEKSGK